MYVAMNASLNFRILFLVAAVVAGTWPVPPAAAEDAKHLGTFGDWEAYQESEGGRKVCYMGSEPKKERGKYTKRGDTYMLITHRPAESSFDVVSVAAGYTYQSGSEVEVRVGTRTFKLFTDAGHAFAYDTKGDAALVEAMIRGANMVVKGRSSRGTLTTDTYSLTGFTAAHKAVDAACGRK